MSALTPEQLDRIARIVSDKHSYIDIHGYGGTEVPGDSDWPPDDDQWRELARDFADATAEVAAPERDVLAAIVRDLAEVSESRVWDGQYGWCDICQDAPHTDDCAYRRARAWLASQEPKT